MSVELLQNLSLVSYVLAAVFFLTAVALFFLLGVPKLVGDISGANAKKAIESIRQQNETTGDKAYKPSAVNVSRGKITDKMTPSGRLVQRNTGMSVTSQTAELSTADLKPKSDETTVLAPEAGATTVLAPEAGATTVLDQNVGTAGETVVLTDVGTQPFTPPPAPPVNTGVFTIDVEMGFCGSAELIE